MKRSAVFARSLLWLVVGLLVSVAFAIDWQWIKTRGWMGCAVAIWGAFYWDRRIVGAKAFIGPMFVDSDTPRNERLPTDVTGLVVLIGGLALTFNAFGM
jgi:hypothetical protein